MAFCLNPDCPHRKKIGRPAEFREGFTHCSDCGSPLSEEVAESEELIEKEAIQEAPPRRIIPTNLCKRILYTIGFVLLYKFLILIPIPGIDLQVFEGLFVKSQGLMEIFFSGLFLERVSAFALGVLPYLSAYMIVEILSLFIQPLKSWREEGYQGRIKIREVALWATFLLALFHGYAVAQGLENMVGPVGERVIRNPGLSFRLISALTLAAGAFLTIWIAELITRKGIGHGISILLFVGYGPRIVSNISQIILVIHQNSHSPFGYFLLFAMIIFALIALIVLMEKSHRKIFVKFNDGLGTYIPLKFTTAGITPADWTSSLLMLPLTILQFIHNPSFQKVLEALIPGHLWYYILYAIAIIFLYYFFTSFFYNPSKIISFLKNRQASIVSPDEENKEGYIDRSLERMIPVAALYLCLFVFVQQVVPHLLDFNLDGVTLIITVAIILDLAEDLRLRSKKTNLVKVAELHDVPMAGLVKSLLEQKGLPCYLRGYYHRALLYFFGPYIEISVLVPEDRMSEAKEVIDTYLDEKILSVRSPKALDA